MHLHQIAISYFVVLVVPRLGVEQWCAPRAVCVRMLGCLIRGDPWISNIMKGVKTNVVNDACSTTSMHIKLKQHVLYTVRCSLNTLLKMFPIYLVIIH